PVREVEHRRRLTEDARGDRPGRLVRDVRMDAAASLGGERMSRRENRQHEGGRVYAPQRESWKARVQRVFLRVPPLSQDLSSAAIPPFSTWRVSGRRY